MSVEDQRRAAATAAAALAQPGQVLGLGTGRTAAMVVEALIARGTAWSCVATSLATEKQAREGGLTVLEPDAAPVLDVAFDGADEVDGGLDLVKGLGGALVRERLVERTARRLVIVVDQEKLVEILGRGKVPVEVIPFGAATTLKAIEALGATAALRGGAAPFRTDNGNWIADLVLASATREKLRTGPGKRKFAGALKAISGVVDHGLFLDMAADVLVGKPDGTVEHRTRSGS